MTSREERWQERLAMPVLVAALASIPAMFLTVAEGALGTAGHVLDLVSGAVLVAETVILFVVAEHKRAWIRGHLGLIALTVAVVVAVVFALGPVQVLRLVRTVGALRILRAGRIVKAARAVGLRHGFRGRLAQLLAAGAGVLVAVFVGVVLSDPTSRSRDLLTDVLGTVDTGVVVALSAVAGIVLGGATYLLARDPGSGADADDVPPDEAAGPGYTQAADARPRARSATMTEGSMTGRPYGGANERPDGALPGERPDEGSVGAAPEQSPRAAQGPMSDDVTEVPDRGADPGTPSKAGGMPDATGPQG